MSAQVDLFISAASTLAAGVLAVYGLGIPAALVKLVPAAVSLAEMLDAAGANARAVEDFKVRQVAFASRAAAPTLER